MSRSTPGPVSWGVDVVELAGWVDGEVVARELFAEAGVASGAVPSFWLDSSRTAYGSGRFSYLGVANGPLSEVLTYRVGDGSVQVSRADGEHTVRGDVVDVLRSRLAGRRVDAARDLAGVPFTFTGGYVGWFGYELRADCGYDAGRHRAATFDAAWMFADRFVALDHEQRRGWVVVVHDQTPGVRESGRAWAKETAARLGSARPAAVADGRADGAQVRPPRRPGATRLGDGQPSRAALEAAMVRGPARYVADVERCLQLLAAGESYEICLTDNLHLPAAGDDLQTYLALRQVNPAPYSALVRMGDVSVSCSSPERFLTVDAHGHACSKPIKGTVPRHDDPAADAAAAAALAADAKARAENLMIVDLLRNDLSGVCDPASVRVDPFLAVESYATVHQLVSTVHGDLRPDVDALDCVRRCFPPGSMTGAPKHRTTQLVDELEDEARGVYSGALGWVGLDGALDLNVVIRTAVRVGDEVRVGAGGAVVLDSDPHDELDEMLLKAAACVRGLQWVGPSTASDAPVVDSQAMPGRR